MTTLVLVGCLLACSICVYAGDSAGNGHLVIEYGSGHSATDVVQPGNKYFVVEGSQVRVQCKAIVSAENEHPPSVGWTKVNTADWSLAKVGSDSEKTVSDLVLTRVNASHAGRYDCVAAHSLANQSIELFVSSDSAPPKKLGPVMKNETLTLECKASKPAWTFNGMPITDSNVKQDGNKLTIESPVGARTGVYMCTASGDGGIAQRQMFQVRGAPEIEHSATNKNLMEGEKAVLKCDVVGYPTPAIKWQKKDAETGDTTPVVPKTGKVDLSVHKGIKDALLSISNLEYSDSGEYTCIVDSVGIGNASFTISLRVKDKLAALWPFLGIVVEVIVLVTIIFIYEKRRSSKDETVVDEEDDEEEQKKALTTGDTVDVRQRGVKS